jgi:hypothetical protein
MVRYRVNPAAVAHAEKLIAAHRYVLDSAYALLTKLDEAAWIDDADQEALSPWCVCPCCFCARYPSTGSVPTKR